MERNQLLDRIKEFRRIKGWDVDGKIPIMFHSTINGYHHFRYVPDSNHRLVCMKETNNPYDARAIIVYDSSNGQNVGRVPHGLNILLHEWLSNHSLERSSLFCTGEFQHDGPVRGGGPKLKCVYLLEFSSENFNLPRVSQQLHDVLQTDDLFL